MSILPYGFVKNTALRLSHIPSFTCYSSIRKLCVPGTVAGFGCTKVNKKGSMQLVWSSSPGGRGRSGNQITKVQWKRTGHHASVGQRDPTRSISGGQVLGGFAEGVLLRALTGCCREWSDSWGRWKGQTWLLTGCQGGTKDVLKVSCLSGLV